MLLAIDPTTLLVAGIPGLLALVGLMIQQTNARRERREKDAETRRERERASQLAEAATAAKIKVDRNEVALDAWQKMVEQLRDQQVAERTTAQSQIVHLGEQVNLLQQSNLKYQDENQECYRERADLLKRIIELEKPRA